MMRALAEQPSLPPSSRAATTVRASSTSLSSSRHRCRRRLGRKKSSWLNHEPARRKKAVREWNLQEKLCREERAKEMAAAANGNERCVRACVSRRVVRTSVQLV
jgi:hypothetical protein